MKKSCPYCGRIHEKSYICPKKPKRRFGARKSRDRSDKEAVKFRSSSAWTKKAREIKERDLWRCLVCRERGVINYKNLEVHHIEKVSESIEGRLDDLNLITLCADCHEKAERGELSKEYLQELVAKSIKKEEKRLGQG